MGNAAASGDQRLGANPHFVKYWVSEAVSEIAANLASLALSLTAVVVLSAGAFEMGVLGAARNLPFLMVGLFAGVIVDRMRRRPILVATGLASAALLAIVPLAAMAGALRIEMLYVVAFGTGAMSVLAAVAYRAFLPVLVGRGALVRANSLLGMSSSGAQIAGSGLGGVIIQLATAPLALAISAAGTAAAALLLLRVRVAEAPAPASLAGGSMLRDIREGFQIVLSDTTLRTIVLTGTTHNVFSNGILTAVYVLFASGTLGLTPAEIGLVFAASAPGALVGSALADRLSRAFGVGPTLAAVQVLTGVARLALLLAAVAGPAVIVLAAGELLLGAVRAVFNIHQISLRQSVTPDHQLGRTTGSISFMMWGAVPLGSLLGGWLGTSIGLVPTIAIGIAGTFAASLWIVASPLRALRTQPDAATL